MTFEHVHLIGIGGINMSAVALLLHRVGVRVSGSDVVMNADIERLQREGIFVVIGHDAKNIPTETDLVIHTSAVPETNVERSEAERRQIRDIDNFTFLAEWFADQRVVLVTGTHGKSTTTAMLGLALVDAGLDPTVIVGSRLTSFPDGNLRIGSSDLVVIEGDEYAKHFLAFHPFAVLINNIELDHTDIFSSMEDLRMAFEELVQRIPKQGFAVVNRDNEQAMQVVDHAECADVRWFGGAEAKKIELTVPGNINRMNAVGALTMAKALGADDANVRTSLRQFSGIWRRMEKIGEKNGAPVYSDYGHHPTAVYETVSAFKEAYPAKKIVLCFQPHHRNRTKHLFLDFVSSFDEADELVLCEIYDVAGRDVNEDANISSRDLVDAIVRHDADRGAKRSVVFAENPTQAVEMTMKHAQAESVLVFMSAGDLDAIARASV